MPDVALRLAPVSLPLAALALAGCGGGQQAVNQVNHVAVAPPAPPPSPTELAQSLVGRRLGDVAGISFAGEQVFRNGGATIVCGRVQVTGQPVQRYIALGEEDVFLEAEMQAGQMDQAVAETCVNNAAAPAPSNTAETVPLPNRRPARP